MVKGDTIDDEIVTPLVSPLSTNSTFSPNEEIALSSISSTSYAQIEQRIALQRAQQGPTRVYESTNDFEAAGVVEQPVVTKLAEEKSDAEKAPKPSRKRIRGEQTSQPRHF